MSTLEGRETARLLIQTVSRSFYGARQSIVLDQLIRKEAMRDDELGGRVGMSTKDLAKIAQRLIEDGIVAVHRRQELKEGAPKAQQRTYYFMDYSRATDVIKWRVYTIQQMIDDKLRNELESQGYVCPQCKKAFTTLDAGFLLDPFRGSFFCDVCDHELQDNENEEDVRGSKDRTKRLMEQTTAIRDLLKRMDNVVLPSFNVIDWLALNGPAGTAATEEVTAGPNGQVRIELAGDDDEQLLKAQRERDAAEKRSQNQLPSWIAQSTISGDSSGARLAQDSRDVAVAASALLSQPDSSKPDVQAIEQGEDLDAYYRNLDAAHSSLSPEVEVVLDKADDALRIAVAGVADGGGESGTANANGKGGGGSGKRSRDEVDSGWGGEQASPGGEAEKKKAKVEEINLVESSEDGFEEEDEEGDEADEDPNPLVQIGDRELPFLEITEAMTSEMSPDQYSVYWDVFSRLG